MMALNFLEHIYLSEHVQYSFNYYLIVLTIIQNHMRKKLASTEDREYVTKESTEFDFILNYNSR